MKGGEIFVPKLPTIYIKDLIRSLGKKPKIVGVRQEKNYMRRFVLEKSLI